MHFTVDGVSILKSSILRLALLAAIWFSGFIAGFLIFRSAQSVFVSLMRGASSCAVSIVGLFLVIALPFLITAIAVYESKPVMLYLLCFCKAVLYSVNVLSIFGAYGSAGWLVQLLMMFTENCTMTALWFLWFRYFMGRHEIKRRTLGCCFGFSLMSGVLDMFVISPFAVSVIIT